MQLFERIANAERYLEPFALVTLLSVNGISPRTEGRMAVFKDGSSSGTIGGGLMEHRAIEEALSAMKEGKSRRLELPIRSDGMAEVYIDVPIKDRKIIIVGAGHVAEALARVFYFLSWNVFILDNRKEWANEKRFPHSHIIVYEDIVHAFDHIDVDGNTAIVITNPEEGIKLFKQLEDSHAFYVGMVGSRKRDFSSYRFLHCPAGLDIGGESPEEVALSISSEVLSVYNKKSGSSLSNFRDKLVVVRGAGDLATGVIVRLKNAGYSVIALECKMPTVIRRTVSFASAVFDGECVVEGVKAVLCKDIGQALSVLDQASVPVIVDQEGKTIEELKPRFVVDAIIAKKNLGTNKNMADFVVALGPGFNAGVDSDVVIETMRGHSLGTIIKSGYALANTAIPAVIAGFGKERVIHSPCSGVFKANSKIGDIVKKGDVIAFVDSTPVYATIDGKVRGLLHDGISVPIGFKISDIDPRGESAMCMSISDKARAIAGGVLEAIDSYCANVKR